MNEICWSHISLKKDYQLFKQAFGIAKERKYIGEDFFAGYYKIRQPKSIKKTEKVKSFNAHNHKLRHSFSTNGVVAGIDYKVMEETMGHSDIRITMDTYTDVQKTFQKEQLQKYVDKIKMELGNELNQFYSKDKELINA